MNETDKKLLYGALILLALSFVMLLVYCSIDMVQSASAIYSMKKAQTAFVAPVPPVRFDKEYISEVCRYI